MKSNKIVFIGVMLVLATFVLAIFSFDNEQQENALNVKKPVENSEETKTSEAMASLITEVDEDEKEEEKKEGKKESPTVENSVEYPIIASGESPVEATENVFPDYIMVINASETTPVSIKREPSENSESLGVVYGNLMHIEVLNNLDNGYSEIATWDYKTMEPIQGYIATSLLKKVTPQKDFGVVVDTNQQQIYIYKNEQLIKNFLCSTGIEEGKSYTPKGIYLLGDRGTSFYSKRYGQGGYNWVRFCNNYLFHSVPFDVNRKIIPEEADKLGEKASHGCVRLSIDDAQWFYDNMPRGTMVIVK